MRVTIAFSRPDRHAPMLRRVERQWMVHAVRKASRDGWEFRGVCGGLKGQRKAGR